VTKPEGIYAFLAKCTHLGCTPRWEVNDQRFKCPCHGSNFNIDGQVVAGPAPEPLKRCGISLGQDGQIVVNRALLSNNPSDIVTDQYFLKKERYS
jgi:cytochrome b6-f complex iron-sulfur subunit